MEETKWKKITIREAVTEKDAAIFWEKIGFVQNGADEWGEPLMILPPTEDIPITVEILADPEDWQLKN